MDPRAQSNGSTDLRAILDAMCPRRRWLFGRRRGLGLGLVAATSLLLADRTARADVSVTLSQGVGDALAQHAGADAKPPTAKEVEDAVNDTLRDIANAKPPAGETPAQKQDREQLAEIAADLLAGGQTVEIVCREEAAGKLGLEDAYSDSEPGMLGAGGAATKGDFDGHGKPKPKAKAVIVVECGFIQTYGLFDPRGEQSNVIGMIGHELVHASDAKYKHAPQDPNAEVYDKFRKRFAPVFQDTFERKRREARRRKRSKKTAMAPTDHGPYLALSPGLIHIDARSGGGVGYQWGAQGGYLLRGPGRFAAGVGASFEHALTSGGIGMERYANHLLRVQGEVTPGVLLVDGDLFVHANVALGYGPATPEASAITVSLVERQASVINTLKLVDTAARSIWRRSDDATSASVVITASIVAILGASMAAPLAMPPTTAPLLPTATTVSLRWVSVVRMASAASAPEGPRPATRSGTPPRIAEAGTRQASKASSHDSTPL